MDTTMVEERLENIERRLVGIEQILPTLATREELGDLRRHMTMLFEHQDEKIQLLAEHLLAIRTKLDV